MARRILIENVTLGLITLDDRQAHHLRNVLRLQTGNDVEVFDKSGIVGAAVLSEVSESRIVISVQTIMEATSQKRIHLTIASAIPKAARADWLIEKCGELDVDIFIPLQTRRSVTEPGGKNKFERWQRIAEEASKQSNRAGVLKLMPLFPLQKAIDTARNSEPSDSSRHVGLFLSTAPSKISLVRLCDQLMETHTTHLTVFVGPEGGWTDDEIQQMNDAGFTAVGLTQTILRIETAALAAAAIIKSCVQIVR